MQASPDPEEQESADGEPLESGEESFWTRAYALFQKHRLRASKFVLAIFVIAVVMEIGSAVPRDVRIDYRFPDHSEVVEARLEYEYEGEQVREVTLRWPEGAPRSVRDTVELSPGDYDVSVLLVGEDGMMRELHGELTAPADGVVRVRLH